jgi:hypothetical protein
MVTHRARSVVLQFDPAADVLRSGKRLSEGISAAVAVGDALWLAHDETVAVERLVLRGSRRGAMRYAGHRRFDLRDLFSLPMPGRGAGDDAAPEADLEGLSFADGFLWIAGSHSARRGEAKGAGREAIAALGRVVRAGNRFLLARIPVARDDAGPTLATRCRIGDGRVLRAAKLRGGRRNDDLTRSLRDDPHLGPFLGIPSKDNGFDIEGLAAAPGGRLFVGLRGPVLDGWACVLEIRVDEPTRRTLALRAIARPARGSSKRAAYRKHFLDLGGAGVRDLCFAGRDLLVLSGPPMHGKGRSRVHRWKNALGARGERMLGDDDLPVVLDLPYRKHEDHAEAITVVARRGTEVRVMVIHDSAAKHRRVPPAGLRARIHALSLAG